MLHQCLHPSHLASTRTQRQADGLGWLLVSRPPPVSVLHSLAQARLVELSRKLGISIPAAGRKDAQIAKLIRPPRERDEELWDWRTRAPLLLVFTPPEGDDRERRKFHLSPPVPQRLPSQGFSARYLSREPRCWPRSPCPRCSRSAACRSSAQASLACTTSWIAMSTWWEEDKRGDKLHVLGDLRSSTGRTIVPRSL
jgi:hypothetical protein